MTAVCTQSHHVSNDDGSETYVPRGAVVDAVPAGREAFFASTDPAPAEDPADGGEDPADPDAGKTSTRRR